MKKTILILVASAAMGFFVQPAEAAQITLQPCFTGDCALVSGSIVVNVTDDVANENDGSGDVKIVIQNLTNGFIDELGLLYIGGMSGSPAIEGFAATGAAQVPSLGLAACPNDNTNQSLNICFDFPNKNADRFSAGQTVTLFLDSATTSFLTSGFDTTGAYAHVQGLPPDGSVKLVDLPPPPPVNQDQVPEPASLLLLGSGMLVTAAARRRKK